MQPRLKSLSRGRRLRVSDVRPRQRHCVFRPNLDGTADGSTEMTLMRKETDPLASARPVLSAVVFAYRNEDTILRAVSSLVQQDFEEPFEVIVATSGGDRTAELARQNFPGVRVVESPVRMMPGGARNLGMKLACGEIIAFSKRIASLAKVGSKTESQRIGPATKLLRAPLPWQILIGRQRGPPLTSATTTGWSVHPRAPQDCHVLMVSRLREQL